MQPKENEYEPIIDDNSNVDQNQINPPPEENVNPSKPQENIIQPNLPPQPNASPYPPQNQPPPAQAYQPPQQVIYQPAVQPLYPQNVVVGPQQPFFQGGGIVVNQGPPFFQQQTMTVNPVIMICPFCKQQITTIVEPEFNCCACCICCFIGVFYFVMQAVRGKDLCCNDAKHRCPNCNNIVGNYQCL